MSRYVTFEVGPVWLCKVWADACGAEIEKGEYEQDAQTYELLYQEAKGVVRGGCRCGCGARLEWV